LLRDATRDILKVAPLGRKKQNPTVRKRGWILLPGSGVSERKRKGKRERERERHKRFLFVSLIRRQVQGC